MILLAVATTTALALWLRGRVDAIDTTNLYQRAVPQPDDNDPTPAPSSIRRPV